MIQIYLPTNENYDNNGDITLQPIDCIVSAEINKGWSLELSHPIDESGRWKFIVENAVVKAPSFNGEQLFRIIQTEKQDTIIKAIAQPIFLDAAQDCFLVDVRPTNKTGQEALDIILAVNDKYTGHSDITKQSTAYYYLVNALEAIGSEDENSFLSRWGGEVFFDNYDVYVNERCGGDYGVELLYGKNLPTDGVKETIDMTDVVTRIVPKAYNGRLISGTTNYVDSPIIDNYPTVRTRVIEYENIVLKKDLQGGEAEGKTVCNTQAQLNTALRNAANSEFTNGIDKPKVSIAVDMILLGNTEEYKNYARLERVGLGDTVHLKHSRLGITADARVVSLEYDSCRDQVIEVEIGDVIPDIMDVVSSASQSVQKVITPSGNVIAERIQGLIDGTQAQLHLQNDVAQRQEVRAILFEDLDPESPTFGAMSLGTQGFEISRERTPDGEDWVWTTFGTAEGFTADLITAGTLNAININGGNIYGTNITGANILTTKTYTDGDWTITDTSRLYDGKLRTESNVVDSVYGDLFTNIVETAMGRMSFSTTEEGWLTPLNAHMDGSEFLMTGLVPGDNSWSYEHRLDSDGFEFNMTGSQSGQNSGTLSWKRGGFWDSSSGSNLYKEYPIFNGGVYGMGAAQGNTSIANKTLSSGTSWQNLGAIYFPEIGCYRLNLFVRFNSNATGRRGTCISDTATGGPKVVMMRQDANAVNGAYTSLVLQTFVLCNNIWNPVYINAYQNSGADLAVTTRYTAEWTPYTEIPAIGFNSNL